MNPKYIGWYGGRAEVWKEGEEWAIDEIRFFTDDYGFTKFRDDWDLKDIDEKTLNELTEIIKTKYHETPR